MVTLSIIFNATWPVFLPLITHYVLLTPPMHLPLSMQCLEALPLAQYNLLAFMLYVGPLLFLFLAYIFIVAVLVNAFMILKKTVKDVSLE